MSENLRFNPMRNFTSLTMSAVILLMAAMLTSTSALAGAAMSYTIPKGEFLEADYTVDLVHAKLRFHGDYATLDYELPKEIDGNKPQRFRLSGSRVNGIWQLATADQRVHGSCIGDRESFNCQMAYSLNEEGRFPLDINSAKEYLASRPEMTPDQVALAERAQLALSHEAIGIIKYRK